MTTLKLKPIVPVRMTFTIRGTSPLIQHAWSEKGLKQLRMSAAERKKQPKVARDPEAEGESAAYRCDDGSYGLPLTAFKSALIGAAHKDYGLEKTTVRKAFFIPSSDSNLCVPIEFESMQIREDIVRVGAGATDLRYRPYFYGWSAVITAEVDTELLNEQDIVALVNRAGFSVGICEWRPEKGGEYGRFELDTTQPFEVKK
jgi:hypothetical protein